MLIADMAATPPSAQPNNSSFAFFFMAFSFLKKLINTTWAYAPMTGNDTRLLIGESSHQVSFSLDDGATA
ncbi:MAG: hypothetical protein EA377_01500 [Phycisphaerales bacterium]|nr:MAG: hypothetical protein EA377_01500 [Phycisphaerales bacterium]